MNRSLAPHRSNPLFSFYSVARQLGDDIIRPKTPISFYRTFEFVAFTVIYPFKPHVFLQKKVYISSTFRDLKDHRERVIDLFQKFPDKFSLIAMENYIAENILPVDKCVQDVLDCNIYILLIANRYGFIPEGATISVTETEYETAKNLIRKSIL